MKSETLAISKAAVPCGCMPSKSAKAGALESRGTSTERKSEETAFVLAFICCAAAHVAIPTRIAASSNICRFRAMTDECSIRLAVRRTPRNEVRTPSSRLHEETETAGSLRSFKQTAPPLVCGGAEVYTARERLS